MSAEVNLNAAMDAALRLLLKTGTRPPWGKWGVVLFEEPGGIRGRVVPREGLRGLLLDEVIDSAAGKDPGLLLVAVATREGRMVALVMLPILHNSPGGSA